MEQRRPATQRAPVDHRRATASQGSTARTRPPISQSRAAQEASTGTRLARFFTRSLGGELIGVVLIASILPVLVCAGVGLALATHGIKTAERDDIRRAAPAVRSVLAAERRELRRTVYDYAFWTEAATAVRRRDTGWLRENVTDWLHERFAMTSVAIVDAHGALLASTSFTDAQLGSLPGRLTVPGGGVTQDLVRLPAGILIATAAPISSQDGLPAGATLIALERIDAAILARIQRFAGLSGVALHDGATALAATGAQAAAMPLTASVGTVHTTHNSMAVDQPLRDASGRALAWIRAYTERTAFTAGTHAIFVALALGLALALLVALVAAPIYGRRLRRRLMHLTRAARTMALGDVAQPLPVKRRDEIGEANVAFNDMTVRVTQTIDELTGRLQFLTSELSELTVLGDALAGRGDLDQHLASLCEHLADAFHADAAGLYLLQAGGDLVAFSSPDALPAHRVTLRVVGAETVASGRSRTLQERDLPKGERGDTGTARLASVAASPLLAGGVAVGSVALGSLEDGRFERHELLMLNTIAAQIATALRSAEIIGQLETTNRETVLALAAAMEAKDEYTAEHAESLALSAVAVGHQLGLSDDELRTLEYAALLHDIGKIGVPRHILNKPDRLTDEEFAEIARHTILGERISARVDDLKPVARIIRSAHERWDGRGYPDGLAGEQIPLLARILLVCDAFDAMTSNRPYRPAMPVDTALLEVRACAGMQFDPQVVDALMRVWDRAAPLGTSGNPRMPVYIWRRPQPDAEAGNPA